MLEKEFQRPATRLNRRDIQKEISRLEESNLCFSLGMVTFFNSVELSGNWDSNPGFLAPKASGIATILLPGIKLIKYKTVCYLPVSNNTLERLERAATSLPQACCSNCGSDRPHYTILLVVRLDEYAG